MIRVGKMLGCLMGSFIVCAGAQAATPDSPASPYQPIVERNVFGLKPPPPPPAPPEPPKPEPSKILLTGITTILGNKRALLKATMPAKPPQQGKPAEPVKEQAYMLAEGQRDGDLEVLEIDEKAGTVKVNELGTVRTLNFQDNGVKLTSTPPPATAGIPGAPPNPIGAIPPPANPYAPPGAPNPFTPGNTAMKQIPTRTMRLPTPGSTQPGLGFSAQPGVQAQPQVPQVPQMSAEEATIMMEVERERLKMRNDPAANLIPTTRFTDQASPRPQLPQ
jgi:hypothetical protein